MAILSSKEILKLVENGSLKIEPFSKSQVGPGSVDLRLGNEFRVFKKDKGVFHVNDDVDHRKITKSLKVENGNYVLINPGELIHGITKETVTLPDNLSARIEGRSRFARIGLLTHVSSGFIQPGSSAKIVLEIVNLSPMPLALYPGTKICQIILEEVRGRSYYRGKFSGQKEP